MAMLCACALISCKKEQNEITPIAITTATSTVAAPTGFTWENSRNVNFTITITDTRFPAAASMISIYDADPNNGGNLIAKGAATATAPFKSTLYISNQITQVYVVKTAPDNTNLIQKVQTSAINIAVSIGV